MLDCYEINHVIKNTINLTEFAPVLFLLFLPLVHQCHWHRP